MIAFSERFRELPAELENLLNKVRHGGVVR
jgi:hypothetical protein